jgi:type IV pilus assembly protein PilO
MDLNLDELKNLSPKLKGLIILLVCIAIGYLYYLFFLQSAINQRVTLGGKLDSLQKEVAEKQRAVGQLDKYIREIDSLKQAFTEALLKLPNEREIAGILSAVVASGKSTGVDFLLFEPKQPEAKAPPPGPAKAADPKGAAKKPAEPEKFYEEIPIKVQLQGGFHNTVSFFDQVARLPRIVNVEEIVIGDAQDVKGRGRLVKTACTVKTYMFVEKKQDKKP